MAKKRAPSRNSKTYWLCQCDCGQEKEIQTCHLTSGAISSCGCKKIAANGDIKKCPICGKDFQANNYKRKYCYDCSPEGLSCSERLRHLDRKLKSILVARKGGKCERCGYCSCEGALQFHHIDPTEKEFTVASVNFGGTFNMKSLLKEVDKCVLLCANCHAEEHYIKE